MRLRIPGLALALCLLVPLGLTAQGAPQEAAHETAHETPAPAEAGAATVSLDDLNWLVGHWQGEPPGGGLAEEVWTAPAAGAMMGSFRWTRGEKVVVYEFLLLEETPEGLVLRLRHFSTGSKAWEEKDAPLDFHLTEGGPKSAVFDAQTENGWLRLKMHPEGDTGLVVILEREGGGPLEFRYTRSAA
jgi:hypothetical protein